MVSEIPLFLLFALRAVADTILPTDIAPEPEVDQLAIEWIHNDGVSSMTFNVDPLTPGAGMGQTSLAEFQSVNEEGPLVIPTDSGNSTGSEQIAFLTCDANNDSDIDPGQVFSFAADRKPKAIVLYSLQENSCNLSDRTTNYSSVFTMTSTMSSLTLFNNLNISAPPSPARIATHTVLQNSNSTGSPPSTSSNAASNDNNGASSSSAPTTAVAMSILYSITGIITLLFLIIIATGAVRAHRHPERYGPRNGFPGRPRQSRAKGLARAMLETLPIVKFGDPVPDKPARDIELESANTHGTNNEAVVAAGAREDGETPRDANAPEQEGGLGPNQAPPAEDHEVSGSGDGDLGCSICTEDFTRGEDVRVLPCNHKYHPACIDPWLLNVSGTCPLCRVDLRPVTSNTSELPSAEDIEEPVVVAEATEADTAGMEHNTAPSSTRRRMSRLLDFNRLRHAEPEERIAALRRYRTQDRAETTATANGEDGNGTSQAETTNDNENGNGRTSTSPERREERNRRSRFTRTIRAAFDIRTVASPGHRSAPRGDASMVGGRGA